MNKWQIVKNLVTYIDIYGAKVEINFQKKPIHNTFFGGVVTIILFISLVLGSYFYGKELIEKAKPTVISSERYVKQPERIQFNSNNQVIMVGLQDRNSQTFIDPSIFQVFATLDLMKMHKDTTTGEIKRTFESKEIKLRPCTINDSNYPELVDYFSQISLSQLHCFDESEDAYIEGDFDAENLATITIQFRRCDPKQSIVKCATEEEIEQKIGLSYFEAYLVDKVIDPSNLENPFINQGRDIYSPTSTHQGKEIQLYFTNSYIQTDIGILYEQLQEIRNYTFADLKETFYFADPLTFVNFKMRPQKHRENIMKRRYQKLAEVVAQIGGLLKVLATFGSLLCLPFATLHLNKEIINQLFNFEYKDKPSNNKSDSAEQHQLKDKEEEEQQMRNIQFELMQSKLIEAQNSPNLQDQSQNLNNQTQSHLNNTDNIYNNQQVNKNGNNFTNTIQSNQNTNNKLSKRKSLVMLAKQFFVYIQKVIKYDTIDYILHLLLPNSTRIKDKRQLVDHSINKVEQHLDVLYLLSKFLEVDKLKSILLNDDQMKLFEYLPKPLVSIDQSSGEILLSNNYYRENKSAPEKALDAYEGFINIMKKQKKSHKDAKLLDLVDQNIISLAMKNLERSPLIAPLDKSNIYKESMDLSFKSPQVGPIQIQNYPDPRMYDQVNMSNIGGCQSVNQSSAHLVRDSQNLVQSQYQMSQRFNQRTQHTLPLGTTGREYLDDYPIITKQDIDQKYQKVKILLKAQMEQSIGNIMLYKQIQVINIQMIAAYDELKTAESPPNLNNIMTKLNRVEEKLNNLLIKEM